MKVSLLLGQASVPRSRATQWHEGKSAGDKRLYRGLELHNGMKVSLLLGQASVPRSPGV